MKSPTALRSLVAGLRRSRKGAWIEIPYEGIRKLQSFGRSRKGAWIEIGFNATQIIAMMVAPARERGLKWLLIQH